MRKLTQEIEKEFIDNTTGEVINKLTQKTYTASNEPNYIKLYLDDLAKLKNLPPSANNILYLLMQNMDYKNRIYITKSIKDNICKSLNISDSSLNKAIKIYIDKGLFTKLDAQTYFTNPDIFGRGAWSDIKEIRMLVSYSKQGKLVLNYEEYNKKIVSPTLFE